MTGFVLLTFGLYSYHARHGDEPSTVKAPAAPSSATAQTAQTGSASQTPTNNASSSKTYKDGQYTGSVADAYYGYIQVLAIVSGGKLTDVRFLQYPNDQPNSVAINSQAMPYLKQEALQAQSAHVNIISGATDTSQAFVQSLSSALSRAAG